MKERFLKILILTTLVSCRNFRLEHVSVNPDFGPPDGYVYLFAGDSPGEIGGIKEFPDGYCDHIGMPAGLSFNTVLGRPAPELLRYKEDSRFDNMLLSLGVDFEGQGEAVNAGEYDDAIHALGLGIRRCGRPVFLRIGYDFDGPDSAYDPDEFIKAYRRIADRIRTLAPGRTVLVWQARSAALNRMEIEDWYPGDEYCDWLSFSVRRTPPGQESPMIRLAEEKDKALMIGPVFPEGFDFITADPEEIWEKWFIPFLNFIDVNRNRIAAVSYRSVPAGVLPETNTTFLASPELLARWQKTLREPGWIHRGLTDTRSAEEELSDPQRTDPEG